MREFTIPSNDGERRARVNDAGTVAWIAESHGFTGCVRDCSANDAFAVLAFTGTRTITMVHYCDDEEHAGEWDMVGGWGYPAHFERAIVSVVTEQYSTDGPDFIGTVDRESASALFSGRLTINDIRALCERFRPKMTLGDFVSTRWLGRADEVRDSIEVSRTGPDGNRVQVATKTHRFDQRKTAKILDEARRAGASTWGFDDPGELVYHDGLEMVTNAEPQLPDRPTLRLVRGGL